MGGDGLGVDRIGVESLSHAFIFLLLGHNSNSCNTFIIGLRVLSTRA